MHFLTTVTVLWLGFTLANASNSTGQVCFLTPLDEVFPANYIDLTVDHFHNESKYAPHSDRNFSNRFWFDKTYYKPGGPVIVFSGGELTGTEALSDFELGLPHKLAKRSNGLVVALEHRYFGRSIPVPVRNAKDYRFLSTEQAMADLAEFAQKVVFPGFENMNLTALNAPWFVVGCSYAGGIAAFERIQYPDLFWGAISSSGVTVPVPNYWEYFDTVRKYAPQDCADTFLKVINIADNILYSGNTAHINQLKTFFRVPTSSSDAHFAGTMRFEFHLQALTWVPYINRLTDYGRFCPTITATELLRNWTAKYKSVAEEIVANGGWANETESLTMVFLNYMGDRIIRPNTTETSAPDAVPLSMDPFLYGGCNRAQHSYNYLKCSEWGLFQSGQFPPGVPQIISALRTYRYTSDFCGLHYDHPSMPDGAGLRRYGEYNVSYPRLMLVGGERDPWRPATPLASRDAGSRLDYPSTLDEPYHVIPQATHCWDWEGLPRNLKQPGLPPESIKRVHEMEVNAITQWLQEWHDLHPGYNAYAR